MQFSTAVKFSGTSIENIFKISISGSREEYDFTWEVPYWESNQYAKDVFIELFINSILTGEEKIYLYIDNLFVSDSREYQLLARNSTSRTEFLPLAADL